MTVVQINYKTTLEAQNNPRGPNLTVPKDLGPASLEPNLPWNKHHVEITICPRILSRLVRDSQISLTDVSPKNLQAKMVLWTAFKQALTTPWRNT